MARRRGRWTDDERRQVLEELKASGLTVAAFARERGLSSWTIYEWRRRLGDEREVETGGQVDFLPVHVVPDRAPYAPLEVSLANGCRVSVPRGFDADELRRVVGVLLSC